MKAILWKVAIGCPTVLFVATAIVLAQDSAASTEQDQPSLAAPADMVPLSQTGTANQAESWRYKQHDGRWWYWLPSNRWVVWMDGRWVDPPTGELAFEPAPVNTSAPQYVMPRSRLVQPRPQSWYYTDRVYDGPYYYYDEFYSPYGGARPYSYYPVPRPYSRNNYYGRYPYNYGAPGAGVSVGGGRGGVRIGIGF
jgi:hypothetical protein